MLNTLDIKNIAIIEHINIEMPKGLIVLTGETGAGKSIIIDAVNLLLGARTNKTLVRSGEDKAFVQGLFGVPEKVCNQLSEQGIETDDGQVIISREISSEGKSVCRINGVIVPQNTLREIGAYLINIHGQQDNQSLLNSSKHIDFLDGYAKTDLSVYRAIYEKHRELQKQIEKLSMGEQERLARIDLLKYQTEEIENAGLKPGEKEELCEKRNIIENAENIAVAVNEAYGALYEEGSAYDLISRAASALNRLDGIDTSLDTIASQITDMQYAIEDCAHELRSTLDSVEFDENELNDIEERVKVISSLEKKYGGNEQAVLDYYASASEELEEISNADETISVLKAELEKVEENLKKAGKKVTELRKKAALSLQKEIETSLAGLDMPKVHFEVSVLPAEQYGIKGADEVEFLICTNAGEQTRPLVQIASGGELSRVMLAMKSILADDVDTLIFDEIDTGVSGSAAQKIARRLSKISVGKQVICISHQPQIAAAADNHYKIRKHSEENRTITEINGLSQKERVMEIARIIDGDNITQTAVAHAKEMLGI